MTRWRLARAALYGALVGLALLPFSPGMRSALVALPIWAFDGRWAALTWGCSEFAGFLAGPVLCFVAAAALRNWIVRARLRRRFAASAERMARLLILAATLALLSLPVLAAEPRPLRAPDHLAAHEGLAPEAAS
jgi:hypothetical protein